MVVVAVAGEGEGVERVAPAGTAAGGLCVGRGEGVEVGRGGGLVVAGTVEVDSGGGCVVHLET